MTLSNVFENYEVCHATGIELDIIRMCDLFCTDHLADYKESWTYDTAQSYLTGGSEINPEDLSYFVHESLTDYMNEHAPIGCYFGSHKGDSTLGYWLILEYDLVGDDYMNCQKLPYKQSGYPIYNVKHTVIDKLHSIESFFLDNYADEFIHTELWDTIAGLTIETKLDFNTAKFCEKIMEAFYKHILPHITPKGMTWQLVNDYYGLYPKLPVCTKRKSMRLL